MTRYIVFFLFCILPYSVLAAESTLSIFTVQISTHRTIETAQMQFDEIVAALDADSLDYLRIEKIGKFYPLRIAKFNDRSSAARFLASIKHLLPNAIVMDAYFKEGRIIRMYTAERALPEAMPKQEELPQPAAETEVENTVRPGNEVTADNSEEVNLEVIAALVSKEDYDSALNVIREDSKKYPEHPALNAWHGTVLLKANKPEEALPYMEKAAALSPSVPDYHNGVGYCLFFLNQNDKAIISFNRALSLDSSHIDALSGLGIIYAKSGDKEKAVDVYNRLKNLDTGSADKLLKLIEAQK